MLAYVKLARPKQWTKNLVVLAGPLFGQTFSAEAAFSTLIIFVAFCLVSSASYAINDLLDCKVDALHPTKCKRPIAAGGRHRIDLSVAIALTGEHDPAAVVRRASLMVSGGVLRQAPLAGTVGRHDVEFLVAVGMGDVEDLIGVGDGRSARGSPFRAVLRCRRLGAGPARKEQRRRDRENRGKSDAIRAAPAPRRSRKRTRLPAGNRHRPALQRPPRRRPRRISRNSRSTGPPL